MIFGDLVIALTLKDRLLLLPVRLPRLCLCIIVPYTFQMVDGKEVWHLHFLLLPYFKLWMRTCVFDSVSDWPKETYTLSLHILSLLYGFGGTLEN